MEVSETPRASHIGTATDPAATAETLRSHRQTLPGITGAEAGIGREEQTLLALRTIAAGGGGVPIAHIKDALQLEIESRRPGYTISEQGRQTLSSYVNREAKAAGLVRFDTRSKLWHLTPEGRDLCEFPAEEAEHVVNVESGQTELLPSAVVRNTAFERYVLVLLRRLYPHYTWYYQGRDKRHERGLDMVAERIGDIGDEAARIGVQVKNHGPNRAPEREEWLKFMAGCFARRVSAALFVTTGRLTSEQRREASEAGVSVIEGLEELERFAAQHGVETFEQFLRAA